MKSGRCWVVVGGAYLFEEGGGETALLPVRGLLFVDEALFGFVVVEVVLVEHPHVFIILADALCHLFLFQMADRWEDFDEADFLDIDENVAQPLAHHSPKLPRHPAISGSLRNPSPQSVIRPPSRNFDSPPRSAASSRARGPNFHANRSSTLEDLRARNSQSPGRSQFARSMMEPPPTTRPTHEEQRQRLL